MKSHWITQSALIMTLLFLANAFAHAEDKIDQNIKSVFNAVEKDGASAKAATDEFETTGVYPQPEIRKSMVVYPTVSLEPSEVKSTPPAMKASDPSNLATNEIADEQDTERLRRQYYRVMGIGFKDNLRKAGVNTQPDITHQLMIESGLLQQN